MGRKRKTIDGKLIPGSGRVVRHADTNGEPSTVYSETAEVIEEQKKPEEKPEEKKEALFIQPEAVDGLYDVFGKVLVGAAVRFKDVPSDIANEAFPFTQKDKDTLRAVTTKVINKHAPDFLKKYQDEIALTLMLVTVINAKIQLCNALSVSRMAQESKEPAVIVQ